MGKIDLDKLKVESFVTSLDVSDGKTLKGGTNDTDIGLGCASVDNDPLCDMSEGNSCDNADSCNAECQSLQHFCDTEKMVCPTQETLSGACCPG